jgi:hypothetical protein
MTRKRRWFRFNLRAAMGLVVVCGVMLALVVIPAHQRQRAIAEIRAAGGTIRLRFGAEESWLAKIVGGALGPDAVANVYSVGLREAKIDITLARKFLTKPTGEAAKPREYERGRYHGHLLAGRPPAVR